MTGFKNFLMRGNLIELAVAFIMGAAFATVVSSFTKVILDLIGLAGDVEGLSDVAVRGVNIGGFITALITFVLTAAVVYFLIVLPYNRVSSFRQKEEPVLRASTEDLLVEIRDLLRDKV